MLVAARQNRPRTALLGRLEYPKIVDTSFGEALGLSCSSLSLW